MDHLDHCSAKMLNENQNHKAEGDNLIRQKIMVIMR